MTHSLRAGSALALTLAFGLALGCGDSEPTGSGNAQEMSRSPQPAGPAPDPTDPQDTQMGDAGTLPDDFPRELLPPGSTSSKWSAWSGAGQLVSFTSEMEPQPLFDHFVGNLGSSGWTVGTSNTLEEEGERSWQLSATKGDQVARISISAGAETPSEFAIAITRTR